MLLNERIKVYRLTMDLFDTPASITLNWHLLNKLCMKENAGISSQVPLFSYFLLLLNISLTQISRQAKLHNGIKLPKSPSEKKRQQIITSCYFLSTPIARHSTDSKSSSKQNFTLGLSYQRLNEGMTAHYHKFLFPIHS